MCGRAGEPISVLLSADWSIVIGLSVSDLFLAFELQAFFLQADTELEEKRGQEGERKGQKSGGEEKMGSVCKSSSMTDSLNQNSGYLFSITH